MKDEPVIWVSPTEPVSLRRLGQVGMTPEFFGVDFFWVVRGRKIGVQRKEVKDFFASIKDGRLARQVAQMKTLDLGVMVLEGPQTRDKTLWKAWFSVASEGFVTLQTSSITHTAEVVRMLFEWSANEDHFSTKKGGKKETGEAWGVWMIANLPGIGPKLAERIWETVGMPIGLTVSAEELSKVQGLGPRKIQKLLEMFDTGKDR